jgi:hypothetical protein
MMKSLKKKLKHFKRRVQRYFFLFWNYPGTNSVYLGSRQTSK